MWKVDRSEGRLLSYYFPYQDDLLRSKSGLYLRRWGKPVFVVWCLS